MGHCIACHGVKIEPFLDLGQSALANKFLKAEEVTAAEPSFPLELGACLDCGHVQLTTIVPPPLMFDDYLYVSSMSDTLVRHLNSLADTVVNWQGLAPQDLVIDIGCNDTTLLAGFKRHGVRVLGVDPARNLLPFAAERGIEVKTAFFGEATAAGIVATHGRARAMTATNVFPHIPDLADFMRGIATVLADDGVFVIEAHYLLDMLEQGAFDTIYHEHCSYWSLGPMMRLFDRFGLEVVRTERLPIHHGQLRVFVRHKGAGKPDETVAAVLGGEIAIGLPGAAPLKAFAATTYRIRDDLQRAIAEFQEAGKRIAGYGAPAKGNTLLTFLGLGPRQIDWIADKSPLKQGRLTPGTHIPVVSPERIMMERPDYLLLLAWNFADEILAQQAEYRRHGGKFILPVPVVRII